MGFSTALIELEKKNSETNFGNYCEIQHYRTACGVLKHVDKCRLINYYGSSSRTYSAPDAPVQGKTEVPKTIKTWVKDPEPVPQASQSPTLPKSSKCRRSSSSCTSYAFARERIYLLYGRLDAFHVWQADISQQAYGFD